MILTAATVLYLACFQVAALPQIVHLIRRKSSMDCNPWREWLVLSGVCLQFSVFLAAGVRDWRVLVSPIASGTGLAILLALIYRYRGGHGLRRG